MNYFTKLCRAIVISALVLWLAQNILLVHIGPNEVGVRQSATSGVLAQDLGPGWHWRIPGVHKVIVVPSTYFMLDYTLDDKGPQKPLQIRTKDNNILELDVSVPVRIKPKEAHQIVRTGNHFVDPDKRLRYQRLAEETATSVLREELAVLDSVGFYSTERRLQVTEKALVALNKQLEPMGVEAESVLIRAVKYRPEYEKQLQRIQLNEQNKLLDSAAQKLAGAQQTLDNFVQGTAALVSARTQDLVKRQTELERAYQVGLIQLAEAAPGEMRAKLAAMSPSELETKRAEAAKVFALEKASVTDAHLLGIKNVQAEGLVYKHRTTSEADSLAARLHAEGDAMLAQVQGEYENKLNALLSSPAGRAYVAWKSADNIQFAPKLTFSSSEGIPSLLRLRSFAEQFMGAK